MIGYHKSQFESILGSDLHTEEMPEEIIKLIKYGVRGLKNYEQIMKNLNILLNKVNRRQDNLNFNVFPDNPKTTIIKGP